MFTVWWEIYELEMLINIPPELEQSFERDNPWQYFFFHGGSWESIVAYGAFKTRFDYCTVDWLIEMWVLFHEMREWWKGA